MKREGARQEKGSVQAGLRGHSEAGPDGGLELERVWGYRGWDCTGGLLLSEEGRLVYCAGAVCVVDDPDGGRQRFFQGHADPVVSLALHRDGRTVASGAGRAAGAGSRPALRSVPADKLRGGGGGGFAEAETETGAGAGAGAETEAGCEGEGGCGRGWARVGWWGQGTTARTRGCTCGTAGAGRRGAASAACTAVAW